LPLAHLCDCNASTTIRTEPNARAASVASFGATGTTPDDGRSLSVLAVLFAEFFLNDMYYPRANTTYAIDIPQPDPDFAYPTYTTIPADVPYAGTTDGDPLYCPAPVSDTTPFLDLSNVYDGTDAIRLGEGGRFNLTDDTNMLWFDAAGTQTYLMGNDPRDNDSAGLIAMHTLAVRNHNHWADEVARLHPQWSEMFSQIFREIFSDGFSAGPTTSSFGRRVSSMWQNGSTLSIMNGYRPCSALLLQQDTLRLSRPIWWM
jgi:hypothetical protein